MELIDRMALGTHGTRQVLLSIDGGRLLTQWHLLSQEDEAMAPGLYAAWFEGTEHRTLFVPLPALRRAERLSDSSWQVVGSDGQHHVVEMVVTELLQDVPARLLVALVRAESSAMALWSGQAWRYTM